MPVGGCVPPASPGSPWSPHPMRSMPSPQAPRILLGCVVAWATAWLLGGGVTAADQPGTRAVANAARPKTIVDHAVTPAGGHTCRHCGGAGCRMHHGHLAACRDGLCAPHCPVRPGQHGFYGTQWRRWPGQGVVQVSAEEEATPVPPPRSQVPAADEESPRNPDAGPEDPRPVPEPADALQPDAALPADPLPEEPVAPARPAPAARLPAVEPPLPPTPPGEPPLVPGTRDGADLPVEQPAPPLADEDPTVGQSEMRYPVHVRRMPPVGTRPLRMVQPAAAQRIVDSDRGL